MEESLVSACILRALFHREKGIKLHSDQDGVKHLALCIAWVNVSSLDLYCCSSCIKILVFKFSHCAAVHGVGIACSEFLNVEFNNSSSDFLVWGESDLDFSVLEFRMLHNVLNRIHDFSYAGLVVCSKKGGSICGDDSLALVVKQFWEVADLKAETFNSLERNVATVIVRDDLRLDICSRCVWRGVHVSDEAYCRDFLVAV